MLYEADGHIGPISEIETDLITLALSINGGSIGKAARDLGVSRSVTAAYANRLGNHGEAAVAVVIASKS